MAGVQIKVFGGISPAVDAELLPPQGAQKAENVELKDGALRTMKDVGSTVVTPTKAGTKKTIYRYGQGLTGDTQYWFSWTSDVDVVKLPIDSDTAERTIFTGDADLGYPAQTDNDIGLTGGTDYPEVARRLGLPPPDISGSTFTVDGTATNAEDPVEASAYVMTYVNSWGEESAPSAATAVLEWQPGQHIDITDLPTAPTGAYNVTKKRLYRSATGNTGTTYQFVTELNVATTSHTDDTPASALGELIETWNWEQLPDDAAGLCLMANGVAAAFVENTVYLSVPNACYAYPPEYRQSTDSPIVGLCAFGQSLFVGTKSFPYVANGVDPSMMAMTKLDVNQALTSKRSMVAMMGGVVYASPDGLYHVSAGGIQPLTDKLFTRDQWQAYKPSSFHSYEIDGRYLAFYDTGSVTGALIFDFTSAKVTTSTLHCTAAYNDPQQDALYMCISGNIKKLGAGSALTKTWRSRVFTSSVELDFAYARVWADAYTSVTFKLIDAVSGSTIQTTTVSSAVPFRITRHNLYKFYVEISGTSDVKSVALAETGEEIESL
jgi:hypothetical protein